MRCFSALLLLVVISVRGLPLRAAELEPAQRPIEAVVDHYIDALLTKDKVTAVKQADDATLIRRLTLDLAGRIPTVAEAQAFVNSTSPTKRAELVDRLLGSPDFNLHYRNELDVLLSPGRGGGDELRKYLTWAVEQNRPWNRMFGDMLAGDENDEHQKAALSFVRTRAKEIDDITNDTSVLFFGVNVTCAKCHDHPLVEDWKQDHYFGMASFFNRTYLAKKDRIGEKHVGDLKFKTKKGEEKQARFMFLTGAVIDEPKIDRSPEQTKELEEAFKKHMKDEEPGAAPKIEFSPRAKLVEVALRDGDNAFFAKNFVNRMWAKMFGRGLIDPLDQIISANPASHPELLDWLVRDTLKHEYDVKRLLRGLALSQAYSRGGQWDSKDNLPEPQYFAISRPRPLSPKQYGLSLVIAASSPSQFPAGMSPEDWKKRREQLEGASNGWAGLFEQPRENFQIAVDEALLFANSNRIEGDLLRDSNDRLLGHVKSLKDPVEQVTAAYWATASRAPSADEIAAINDYVTKRASNPADAWKQVVWALLTGPELRFNH